MTAMPYHEPVILERRELGALALLTLHAPELARAARPGQAVMVRCAPPGSADPLLRRPLFLAGADPAGTVELLVAPEERGLAWLAAQPPGARLDLYGPVGAGFAVDGRARNLLLAGAGPALPALLFLARAAVARRAAVVLVAAAPAAGLLPPPYLLPADVEYQGSAEGEGALAGLLGGAARAAIPALAGSPVAWADQVFLALAEPTLGPVSEAVRAGRLRWGPGFAFAALAGAMPCGLGTCQGCLVETRGGARLRCKDGPIFDLRDLRP
jgi:dihydroorotate dehydrogenase electron transfer subunit